MWFTAKRTNENPYKFAVYSQISDQIYIMEVKICMLLRRIAKVKKINANDKINTQLRYARLSNDNLIPARWHVCAEVCILGDIKLF